ELHEENARPFPAMPDPGPAGLAELLKPLPPPVLPAAGAVVRKASADETRKEETRSPVAAPAGAPATATGKTYVLFEGTVIETVLINRLDGQLAGPRGCPLPSNGYSHYP